MSSRASECSLALERGHPAPARCRTSTAAAGVIWAICILSHATLLLSCNDFPSRSEAGICYVEEHLDDLLNCGCMGACGDGLSCELGVCTPVCGNAICQPDAGESCEVCPEDCGKCPPVCGDGIKAGFEECDDGGLVDGDGCSALCISEILKCGNGVVESEVEEECDKGSLPDDGCCLGCKVEDSCCGNGKCEAKQAEPESCSSCPLDCGSCEWDCGDGICEGVETCVSCAEDCACGDGEVCYIDDCCLPACDGKECGSDSCGGMCGECEAGSGCVFGECYVEGKDCAALLQCVADCGGGAECQAPCLEVAELPAKSKYLALMNCVKVECGQEPTEDCFAEAVADECADLHLTCVPCAPDCTDLDCGLDAVCGLSCGNCLGANICVDGKCVIDGDECGDNACTGEESCSSCPGDCGACCGNGECQEQFGETCKTCSKDCGECVEGCGDGECNGDEDCGSCTDDCSCPDDQVCYQSECCAKSCEDKECGDDGCGSDCGSCEDGESCVNGSCSVTGGGQGDPCPCAQDLSCVAFPEEEICTSTCESNSECPVGMCCLESSDGTAVCSPSENCKGYLCDTPHLISGIPEGGQVMIQGLSLIGPKGVDEYPCSTKTTYLQGREYIFLVESEGSVTISLENYQGNLDIFAVQPEGECLPVDECVSGHDVLPLPGGGSYYVILDGFLSSETVDVVFDTRQLPAEICLGDEQQCNPAFSEFCVNDLLFGLDFCSLECGAMSDCEDWPEFSCCVPALDGDTNLCAPFHLCPKDQNEPCGPGVGICAEGLHCIKPEDSEVLQGVCAPPCATGNDCPDGICEELANEDGSACVPVLNKEACELCMELYVETLEASCLVESVLCGVLSGGTAAKLCGWLHKVICDIGLTYLSENYSTYGVCKVMTFCE